MAVNGRIVPSAIDTLTGRIRTKLLRIATTTWLPSGVQAGLPQPASKPWSNIATSR